MTRMNQNIRKIRKKMEEKAGTTEPENEISYSKLKMIVEKTAGASKRTWYRYKETLEEWGIITEIKGGSKFKIIELLENEDETTDIDQNADKKSVTLRVNKQVLNHMDTLNVDKSNFFEKHALKQYSNIEDKIKDKITYESQKELEFITELVLEDLYRASKGESERKDLYKEKFGRWNDFACEEMRKKAFTAAEELGAVKKPDGI